MTPPLRPLLGQVAALQSRRWLHEATGPAAYAFQAEDSGMGIDGADEERLRSGDEERNGGLEPPPLEAGKARRGPDGFAVPGPELVRGGGRSRLALTAEAVSAGVNRGGR